MSLLMKPVLDDALYIEVISLCLSCNVILKLYRCFFTGVYLNAIQWVTTVYYRNTVKGK